MHGWSPKINFECRMKKGFGDFNRTNVVIEYKMTKEVFKSVFFDQ
jgi:hypothetical protein